MVLVIEGILLPVWVFTSIVYMKESSSRFRLRSRPVFELLVYIHHEFSVCGPQKQGPHVVWFFWACEDLKEGQELTGIVVRVVEERGTQ